ncbi:MAG: LamG domain-containing protein [Labilithrix sp.]|nr:LamG domain-containing protein [Labilithrix sp.]MCW5810825.1 LamG domain-containing protein [Labilithrix sp.]
MRGNAVRLTLATTIGALTGCTLLTAVGDLRVVDESLDGEGGLDGSAVSALADGAVQERDADAAGGDPTGDAGDAATEDGGDAGPPSCVETGDPDLIAYYPLDDATGTTVRDCSGNDRHGVLRGNAGAAAGWTTAGRFGGGYVPGASHIDLGAVAPHLDESKPFTVAAWVNAKTFSNTTNSTYVLGRSSDTASAGWRIGTDVSKTWVSKLRETSAVIALTSSPSQLENTWVHLTATFGGGAAGLYLNGALVDSAAGLGAMVTDTPATLRIGSRSDNTQFFAGTIDEVRIYKRALTTAEISALAAKTK